MKKKPISSSEMGKRGAKARKDKYGDEYNVKLFVFRELLGVKKNHDWYAIRPTYDRKNKSKISGYICYSDHGTFLGKTHMDVIHLMLVAKPVR